MTIRRVACVLAATVAGSCTARPPAAIPVVPTVTVAKSLPTEPTQTSAPSPEPHHVRKPTATKQAALIVVITAAGDFIVDGKSLDLASLEAAAAAYATNHDEPRAVFMADENATYGLIIDAMDALRRGGVDKVSFAVQPP